MHLRLASFALLAFVLPTATWAQWQPDGVPVSATIDTQGGPMLTADGAGGAILVWHDHRSGNDHLYVQRINASGVSQWTPDGVILCTAGTNQGYPTIVSDGAGGAIVAWQDYRTGYPTVFAQRINASGSIQWTASGVVLCSNASQQTIPQITADGAGGAIVTWVDFRSTTNDIYAQRINASGAVQWTATGVALCTAAGGQESPTIVSDGAGGGIVTWQDPRSVTSNDIYAQRINAAGAVQWTADGVALCTVVNDQVSPMIVSDGAGGAIVTWNDFGSGTNYDIYAQRINAAGAVQWTANGVALCTAADDQHDPRIVSDGAGGAIVTWYDSRSGTTFDVYAQRVNVSGAVQWPVNGVALCTAANTQNYPTIVADGAGGAIVTWQDFRSGTSNDIYAQRISFGGSVQWPPDGVRVSGAAGDQSTPIVTSDGAGGAIVTWDDFRSDPARDVYAQRVGGAYGYWGHPEPAINSVADVPGDQGGRVKVNWVASDWDVTNRQLITHYSIWRATDAAPVSGNLNATFVPDPEAVDRDFQGRAIYTMHTAAGDYYYEWVGNQDAVSLPYYSFSAETRSDSTGHGTMEHCFLVFAHTSDAFTHWVSNSMSGHSVDNLAPTAPVLLTAERVGTDVHLAWNAAVAPDLRDYAVYRASASGVTPVTVNFLTNADETHAVDAGAPPGALYYIVTAYDVHNNQSAPSNEASVSGATSVGNTPALTALTVLPNEPNPFTGTTDLRIGLPATGDVSIEVFDVAGRRVRAEEFAHQHSGWRTIHFDGRDNHGRSLASGVYFYRVTENGTTVTNKMVITR